MNVFALPLPPTTNGLYKNIPRGRALTSRYKSWRKSAGWELITQSPKRMTGPVIINYEITTKAKGDPDNYLKALNDILVAHRIIEGDGPNIVKQIDVKLSNEVARGVRVTIKEAA
ncbi:MAG: hypothetical protein AB7R40_23470 [Nitrospiraceae bacterium]